MMQLPLQLIILSVLLFSIVRACPWTCHCRAQRIYCNGLPDNFTALLDNNTVSLEMKQLDPNQVEELLADVELFLPKLQSLTVTDSYLANISFINLPDQLASLILVEDRLQNAPQDIFSNSSRLRTLDLSRNEIATIESNSFRTLRTLEVLNLSANGLTSLSDCAFSGLESLRSLDLSRNVLKQMDDKAFRSLVNLQTLSLSDNRLKSLNSVLFSSLVMLQQLDVSWNRLSWVAPGSLELPGLVRLLLAGNPQLGSSTKNVVVGTGRTLQTVDASQTGLKQVPAALTQSIRTLRLAANSISRVNSGDLDSYPLLQLLDFTSNKIETVEEDALGRLDFLNVLYLTDNKLKEIPKSLPEKLKVLHLERNSIIKVSDKEIAELNQLEVLLLSDNKIKVIEETAFSKLTSLMALDLSRNPIATLQPGCLSGPTRLEVLRLESVAMTPSTAETSFPLSSTEHLVTLDLSGSPGLARQFLADTAALAASMALQELDLSNTELEFVRSDLIYHLPQLRALHLGGNKLNCTNLQWLAVWLRRQDQEEYRDIFCASPANLWGTLLVDLQDLVVNQSPESTAASLGRNTIDRQVTGQYNSKQNSTNFLTSPAESNDIAQEVRKTKLVSKKFVKRILDNEVLRMKDDSMPLRNSSGEESEATTIRVDILELNEIDLSTATIRELAPAWNATSSESVTAAEYTNQKPPFLHPGMIIFWAAVFGTVAALSIFAARFTRRRKRTANSVEDIEVSSLQAGMVELW
ncbi:unnamed protein product [Acanthoscelides obtectus]|uniref:Uncharacterized protein n=1 Tax=Acanthoscelides obtectus TaxID=200917 RepID=A0A9P0LXI7_ACAOB|nr:unnamed protein product [Acanthoscelides obtectus]CAK1651344.1 Insulin-like growth factor-binding protein complex acid labile subunit [Acanthoscelides obtectus]